MAISAIGSRGKTWSLVHVSVGRYALVCAVVSPIRSQDEQQCLAHVLESLVLPSIQWVSSLPKRLLRISIIAALLCSVSISLSILDLEPSSYPCLSLPKMKISCLTALLVALTAASALPEAQGLPGGVTTRFGVCNNVLLLAAVQANTVASQKCTGKGGKCRLEDSNIEDACTKGTVGHVSLRGKLEFCSMETD